MNERTGREHLMHNTRHLVCSSEWYRRDIRSSCMDEKSLQNCVLVSKQGWNKRRIHGHALAIVVFGHFGQSFAMSRCRWPLYSTAILAPDADGQEKQEQFEVSQKRNEQTDDHVHSKAIKISQTGRGTRHYRLCKQLKMVSFIGLNFHVQWSMVIRSGLLS